MGNNFHDSLLIKTARLFLIISFILCLGNIFGFIAMNEVLGEAASLDSIYWQRLFVTKITHMFILPGLWIMIISVGILSWKLFGFFNTKPAAILQVLIILVFINGMFIILPLSDKATALAVSQMQQKIANPEYIALKGREDILGMINFLMMMGSLVIFVSKLSFEKSDISSYTK